MKKENNKLQIQQEIQTTDSSRSMVEMLGTLAVVGVLSIAGIMGYKYAMNRYQVNKIANELNMLSNQIFLTMSMPHNGEYELSLGEVYDEGSITTASYAFDFGCGNDITVETPCTEDEPHYFISLEAVPAEIRSLLAQLMEQLPNVTIVTNNEELLAFVYTRDDVKEEGLFPESISNDIAVTTIKESITTKETLSEPLSSMTIQTITEIVTSAPMITTVAVECHTNDDCIKNDGKTYYCRTVADYASSYKKEVIRSSECRESKILMPTVGISTDWIISEDNMNWYSAKRFCESINHPTMLSVTDLNCKLSSSQSNIWGTCYEADIETNTKSLAIDKLYQAYGNNVGWTSNDSSPLTDEKCVNFSTSEVKMSGRSSDYADYANWNKPHAVCK